MRIEPEFERLYEREFQAVYRAVYLLTGDRAAAEDSTQEAFARCLERWNRLGDKPWVAGWVTTTALNHVRRSLRRRFAFLRLPPESSASSSDPAPARLESAVAPGPEAGDASLDLWRAVRQLPSRQQQAVVLHYAMDLPLAEVAEAMRVSQGAVKAHLARARETLRELVRGEPEPAEGGGPAARGEGASDLGGPGRQRRQRGGTR
ncbi:MAG TPA: sigma-70 family RNA polymerase sigma factor [Actinomycetota bacterium]|nr:sigma-70 family RNA polymerase sigma factor [Actinomycetota bacterium]